MCGHIMCGNDKLVHKCLICCDENCPLPKLPERKQEKIYLDCNPDAYTYDTRAEGFNHCLDVITGDIKDE